MLNNQVYLNMVCFERYFSHLQVMGIFFFYWAGLKYPETDEFTRVIWTQSVMNDA